MLVKDWMTSPVHTVRPEDNISDAAFLMREKKIKHLPVATGAKLVGILSDRDIKEYLPSKGTSLDVYELNYLLAKTKVSSVMRQPVQTAAPHTPVEEAAMILHDRNIGCLPVVEDGKLVGIISDKDIFKVLVEITGVRNGGRRFTFVLDDKPGSIKEVADVIRAKGYRLLNIMSSSEKSAPGTRYVVIRTRGDGDYQGLLAVLKNSDYHLVHSI